MIVNKVSVMVGGEAGAGITRSGFLFAKTCIRGGLHDFGANDYQSLIRGGHNFCIVRADAIFQNHPGDAVIAEVVSGGSFKKLFKKSRIREVIEDDPNYRLPREVLDLIGLQIG